MTFAELPRDYFERVYAGVLGKIIGVYLGRPFEQWHHRDIEKRLGEIEYYVHEELGQRLVVSDDDISGTFTFFRALEDHGFSPHLTPEQIGETWLNYIVEDRTILWWGGMGTSTEHTAYLRLKNGIPAPESGSIAQNGKTVAEQIGAQIFIDAWGMLFPGEPEKAAEFARRAASVSHDGEAIHGAQMIASMEAAAFVESDIDALLDIGLAQIPAHSTLAKMIADVRTWHASGLDWRQGFAKIEGKYGYERYGGGCHMVPNHALIIHALLHGGGDFDASMRVVNTCGYDTDCNSGNVGCILGILNGLAAFEGERDWRGPVADRLYLPTADGGRCITDALTESLRIVDGRRAMAGLEPLRPKGGTRFHFSLPGSVQGFCRGDGRPLRNDAGRLQIEAPSDEAPVVVTTPTFIPPADRKAKGYALAACPTLCPGQTVRALVSAVSESSPEVRLVIRAYDAEDNLRLVRGAPVVLGRGENRELAWQVPDLGGYPFAEVGLEAARGDVALESLTWDGVPEMTLRPTEGGSAWRDAWVNAVDEFATWGEPFRVIQNEGTGLLIHGCREWQNYSISSRLTLHLVERAGIAIHVQGMRRWVALLLDRDGFLRLVKCVGRERVLAEVPYRWEFDDTFNMELRAEHNRYTALMNGEVLLEARDSDDPFTGGAAAFVVTEGRIAADAMKISRR